MTKKQRYYLKIKAYAVSISHINKDPLDGDQTEVLSQMFNIELDFQSGNITRNEYTKRYAKLNMEIL